MTEATLIEGTFGDGIRGLVDAAVGAVRRDRRECADSETGACIGIPDKLQINSEKISSLEREINSGTAIEAVRQTRLADTESYTWRW